MKSEKTDYARGKPEDTGCISTCRSLCSSQLLGLLLDGNTKEIQPGSTNPAVLFTVHAQETRTVLAVWFNITISYSLDRKVTAW